MAHQRNPLPLRMNDSLGMIRKMDIFSLGTPVLHWRRLYSS